MRGRPKHPYLLFFLALGAAVLVATGKPWFQVIVAALLAYLLMSFGMMMLGGMSRPIPEPPPPGELRKVKIAFRCSICGAEVRMTVAPHEDPEPPRHCQEDMELVAPIE